MQCVRWILMCLGLSALAGAVQAETAPARIVSLNLCTDQMLMDLVPPERIAAVSFLSLDPAISNKVDEAVTIGTHRGSAEEVLLMEPDLILAGAFSSRHTNKILETLGYPIETFTPASNLEDVRDNLRRMGELVGAEDRSAELIGDLDRAIEAADSARSQDARTPVYASYAVNGFTAGDGSLLADLVETAGFRTLASELGLGWTARVSLEQLVISQPDIIDLGDDYNDPPSRGTEALYHPALKRLMAEKNVIHLPSNLTICGAAHTADALRQLTAKRAEMLEP